MYIEIVVDAIGERHDLAHRPAELARLVMCRDRKRDAARLGCDQRGVTAVAELAGEVPGDEACGTACDVDVFADQVAVDPREKIVGIEIQILDVGIELGGDVVAQPLRVHPRSRDNAAGWIPVPRDFDIFSPETVMKPWA